MTKITKKSMVELDQASQIFRENRIDMAYLLSAFLKYEASDLHLRRNRPPLYRINGKVLPANMPELPMEKIQEILYQIIPTQLMDRLEKTKQVDFTFDMPEIGRFRCNVFHYMNSIGAALRKIPNQIPGLEDLRVPSIMKELVEKPRGLILITGATGSGKSTTMAGMIQHLNQTQRLHIVTLEDPIEFIHTDNKSTITQRELGQDFETMQEGLSSCLRQDPDVLVVGEMRDLATIRTALSAAETGHLVISTLHTRDAKSAIDRILDSVPGDLQNQIRVQLAASLIGILAQTLLNRSDNKGRILGTEVMVKSPSIEQSIRRNQLEAIPELMEQGKNYYKMHTLNMDLEALIRAQVITQEEGFAASNNPDDLKLRLSGVDRREGYNVE